MNDPSIMCAHGFIFGVECGDCAVEIELRRRQYQHFMFASDPYELLMQIELTDDFAEEGTDND